MTQNKLFVACVAFITFLSSKNFFLRKFNHIDTNITKDNSFFNLLSMNDVAVKKMWGIEFEEAYCLQQFDNHLFAKIQS